MARLESPYETAKWIASLAWVIITLPWQVAKAAGTVLGAIEEGSKEAGRKGRG